MKLTEILDLLEPVSDFERGIALVRDCMSDDATLRELSIRRLRHVLKGRLTLCNILRTEVLRKARAADSSISTYDDALQHMSEDDLRRAKRSYELQVKAYEDGRKGFEV